MVDTVGMKDGSKQDTVDPVKVVKEELSTSKDEVKRLSRELESLKKKASKSELTGLSDLLRKLYKESDDVKLRKQLVGWLKQL